VTESTTRMIKKKQKNTARDPQMAELTPGRLASVAGGDPPPTKIKETLVGG